MCRLVLAAVVAALVVGVAPALPPPSTLEIARLVKRLGAEDFSQREAAAKRLEVLGERALPALRVASKSDDAETRSRAKRLLASIERPAGGDDLKRLRGKWKVVSYERDGGITGPDATRLLTVEEQCAYWEVDGRMTATGKAAYGISSPGILDLQAEHNGARRRVRYYYRLDGDTLQFCGGPPSAHPEKFDARKGTGLTIMTLKREKP